MRTIYLFLLAGLFWELPLPAQNDDSLITVSGLVMPRDDNGIYVRNSEGQFEVEWTGKNVHFGGKPADALGQLLAEHVASLLDIQISR